MIPKFKAWNKKLKITREVCMIEFDDTGRDELIKVWDHPSVSMAKIKAHVTTWKKKDCEITQDKMENNRSIIPPLFKAIEKEFGFSDTKKVLNSTKLWQLMCKEHREEEEKIDTKKQ